MADNQPTVKTSETWKPVVGYEGMYEVSDHGRVRGLDRIDGNGHTRRGRIMKATPSSNMYLLVPLSREGKVKRSSVHRLVMAAFVGTCPEGMQVDHIDNDRQNNRVENLQYVTAKENIGRKSLFGTSHADKVAAGTDHESIKTHCPRRHILVEPNLVPSALKRGRRQCLACVRAGCYVRYHKIKDQMDPIADSYYKQVMKGA